MSDPRSRRKGLFFHSPIKDTDSSLPFMLMPAHTKTFLVYSTRVFLYPFTDQTKTSWSSSGIVMQGNLGRFFHDESLSVLKIV